MDCFYLTGVAAILGNRLMYMGLDCPIATFLSGENLSENEREMEADKNSEKWS